SSSPPAPRTPCARPSRPAISRVASTAGTSSRASGTSTRSADRPSDLRAEVLLQHLHDLPGHGLVDLDRARREPLLSLGVCLFRFLVLDGVSDGLRLDQGIRRVRGEVVVDRREGGERQTLVRLLLGLVLGGLGGALRLVLCRLHLVVVATSQRCE